jgi:ABC-type Zn uptake system ZnuABC Zn-binding protein ZnuA
LITIHGSARPVLLALLLAFAVGACGGDGSPARTDAPAGTLRVVTTTTILAELVAEVGGPLVTVESLVPKGGEVHTFDPKPSDIRRLAQADVVFLNGLGLDEWLTSLVADSGTQAPVVKLGENLPGVTYLAGTPEGGGTQSSGAVNPHLWLNAAYAAKYADRITETLAAADPGHAATYRDQGAAYAASLTALDTELRTRMEAIPAANRLVLSFHDAFPYFAAAYGLAIDGTIVSAPGQDPSAAQSAELVRVVREKGIKAIFAEAQFSEALVRTIADETGAVIVSELYTDSTGDPPKDTYTAMMRWNADQVLAALAAP